MVSMLVRQICPRCVSMFKEDDYGGISRLDNSTRICTSCETDEATEDYFGIVTPMKNWPVNKPWSGDENGNVSDHN